MFEELAEFSGEDTRRIQEMMNNGFENASKDDIELYGKWKAAHALTDERFQKEEEARKAELEERIEAMRERNEIVKDSLKTRLEAARLRLQRAKAGEY